MCLAKPSTFLPKLIECGKNEKNKMRKVSFEEGNYYHIFNRGVDKRNIFMDEGDRWRFLQGLCLFNNKENVGNILWKMERKRGDVTLKSIKDFLIESSEERESIVLILAYCLKDNHFHLLLKEIGEGGIQSFMHKFASGYVKYFNNKYKRGGSLFQGPFKAVAVDRDEYLQYLLGYINIINPAQSIIPNIKEMGIKNKEGVKELIEEFPWSTHQEYLGKRNSIIIEKEIFSEIFSATESYQEFTEDVLAEKENLWRAESIFLE